MGFVWLTLFSVLVTTGIELIFRRWWLSAFLPLETYLCDVWLGTNFFSTDVRWHLGIPGMSYPGLPFVLAGVLVGMVVARWLLRRSKARFEQLLLERGSRAKAGRIRGDDHAL
jgi:hypothetical protein